jgi:O-methyltransferase involved in polyketide biosynthesis
MGSLGYINDAALWAVTCRAHETRRPDRVLNDPFAAHLVTIRGDERFGAQVDSVASFTLAVIAATIDEVLRQTVHEHQLHTVVSLGAGLDTRPYRLDLPSDLRWIEADLAPVLGYKVLRLAHAAPCCQLRRVDADLSHPGGRRGVMRAIARDVMRGLVLTEGLAARFGLEALDDLIERVPPVFKYWIVDAVGPPRTPSTGAVDHRSDRAVPPRDVLDAFVRRGWRPTEFRLLKDQARRFGEARMAGLPAADPLDEQDGVWLFQHAI